MTIDNNNPIIYNDPEENIRDTAPSPAPAEEYQASSATEPAKPVQGDSVPPQGLPYEESSVPQTQFPPYPQSAYICGNPSTTGTAGPYNYTTHPGPSNPVYYPPYYYNPNPYGPPIQPPAAQYSTDSPDNTKQKKKWKSWQRTVAISVCSVFGVAIMGFAGYGIYAISAGLKAPSAIQSLNPGNNNPGGNFTLPPNFGNGEQTTPPDNGNGSGGNNAQDPNTTPSQNNTGLRFGISCAVIDADVAKSMGVPQGLVLLELEPDSDLKNTQAQANDIITKANGNTITSFDDLYAVMEGHNPGDTITLTLFRLNSSGKGGQTFDITVKLLAAKSSSESSSDSQTSSFPDA